VRYRRVWIPHTREYWRRRYRRVHASNDRRWIRPESSTTTATSGRTDLTVDEWYYVLTFYGLACHLCGKPIDERRTYPHDMSPSVDHLVPVSRGGTNVIENLRPAHLVCNVRRSNLPLRGKVRAWPQTSSEPLFDALIHGKPILIAGGLWTPVLSGPLKRWRVCRCRASKYLVNHRRWTLPAAGLLELGMLSPILTATGVTVGNAWFVVIMVTFTLLALSAVVSEWASSYNLSRGRVVGWEFAEATGDDSPETA
jgi:5-methylcytosine-specific restriction endonuclease McrA